MGTVGPPLSSTTKKLMSLGVGDSVVIDPKHYKSIGKRAWRLGIKVAVRRILVGKDRGKLEVFRLK